MRLRIRLHWIVFAAAVYLLCGPGADGWLEPDTLPYAAAGGILLAVYFVLAVIAGVRDR